MIITLVGRPNTGKSRLFNRLADTDRAIVHDRPGVTRDRRYGRTSIRGEPAIVVDTGGLVPGSDETLEARMRRQADAALAEADAVVLLLDGREGLVPADREIVEKLRDADRPVFFAVNKADDPERTHEFLADFYQLGVDLHAISAEHDVGIDALVDAVADEVDAPPGGLEEPEFPRLAVVGRPNVGKSTLINAAVGGERVLTDDEPGTTRDSVDTYLDRDERSYVLVDTAGLRRKSNVSGRLERLSVGRTIQTVDRADIAVLMLDAVEGVTNQDQKIAGVIRRRGCACVVAANKWDRVDTYPGIDDDFDRYLQRELHFLDWAPAVVLSALTGRGLETLFEAVDRAHDAYRREISDEACEGWLRAAVEHHPPPPVDETMAEIQGGTQITTRPPRLAVYADQPEGIDDNYRTYLENRARDSLELEGTPLTIDIRDADRQ